jgi:hypothetical protein
MKCVFYTLFSLSILSLIPFQPFRLSGADALAADLNGAQEKAPDASSAVYDGTTLTEDVTWRGTVLVKGYVVVAPHATLRIEAGTVVRFAPPVSKNRSSRLIVQGRIQGIGTVSSPILMTSGQTKPARGDWGGIFLVGTEKRNTLEQCRIEYADSGIDARYSSINLKMVSITKSNRAILAHDAVVQMLGGTVADSQTGIEAHDSEFEVQDAIISDCQRGLVMNRSSLGISSVKVTDNKLSGLLSDDCRVKITSGEFSENGIGASFKGGEGQIQTTSFIRNLVAALHLQGTRMKIQRCRFSDNSRDAIRTEDGLALLSGNTFTSNKGFNIYNAGRENANAELNWWGSADQSVIVEKIHDSVRDPRSGTVQVFPWLTEKPPFMP